MKCTHLKAIVDLEAEKLEQTERLVRESNCTTLSIEDMDRYGLSCDTAQGAEDRLAEARRELEMARQELQYQKENPEGMPTGRMTDLYQQFIEHVQAGRIVEEWYDVPVHYFKTIQDGARNRNPVVRPNPDDLDEFLEIYIEKEDISEIAGAARNAAVEYVKMPFLRCTDPAFLFNDTPLILVRSQYISLCNELLAYPVPTTQHPDVFVLDGDEGTSKTFFLYYFMYRLHTRTDADGSPRPMSYRCENIGGESRDYVRGDHSMLSAKKVGRYYDWGIFDNITDFEPCNCRSILLVTYETDQLRNPRKFLAAEDDTGSSGGTTRYYSMAPLSYAETCAIAFCPRYDYRFHSRVILPAGVSLPSHEHGDECDDNMHRGFHVSHPMCILTHFVCFRSCLRELKAYTAIHYVTPGPDGRVNAVDASVPEFLFLKRSDDTSGIGIIPYTPYQSVFDYTLGEIKSSMLVSDVFAMGDGVDSLCGLTDRSAYTRTDGAGDDASQLTSLGTLEFGHSSDIDNINGMHRPFYRGFALDLANSMRTSTSNKQFRKVMASILPLVCTEVVKALEITFSSISRTLSFEKYVLQRGKPRVPDELSAFRQFPSIVHTEPVDSRDYDNHMPHHLTVLTQKTATSSFFIYHYKTRAIENLVSELSQR
jgi:hypothetical protein